MRIGDGRVLAWIGSSVLVAAILAAAFWPRALPVDLGMAARGTMRVTVDEEGRTRIKDIYVLSAPLGGRLRRVDAEVGDAVIADRTVLASLQQADPGFLDIRLRRQREAAVKAAAAAVALAEAEVRRAEAELDFARTELGRARRLSARDTIPRRDLDRAEMTAKTRGAALATAVAARGVRRFELETARAALIDPGGNGGAEGRPCCIRIRAPVNGRVLRILQESESIVAAGTALVEIGDPENLEIIADLLSSDAVRIVPGADVMIEDWGGDRKLPGLVRRVEPYGFTKVSALGIEEQRVNVIVELTGPPSEWKRLGHGYRVGLRIVVWQANDVLMLPVSAMFRDGGAWAAFVVEDGRARLRRLEIGHVNGFHAEIVTGVAAGARVVLHPSDRIEDGTRIAPRHLETATKE